MQKWEYARLQINWVDVPTSVCKLTMFQNGGRNGINSNNENDAWKMFDRQLYKLGQDRWELVGVAPFGGGYGTARTVAWHLWFQRPLAE
jgi:ABC-type transporter lipoprotein component MlaA